MAARKIVKDLYVMIRPRGGDFYYSEAEFEIMKEDVRVCKKAGCDGIVIGMLTLKNKIDKVRCAELVNLAYPMGVTFHRAFDRAADAFEALEDVISIGCERLLTSGQQPDAMAGKEMIAELVKKADGRIIIMPGAGITADNISAIAETTAAIEFHSSARLQLGSKISVDKAAIERMLEKLATV
jgi:copper homeostasis protein